MTQITQRFCFLLYYKEGGKAFIQLAEVTQGTVLCVDINGLDNTVF